MSLYDDFEPLKQKTNQVTGWSSGIKLFQSQMQLKKAASNQPRRDNFRKSNTSLAPVIDLKGQRNDDSKPPPNFQPFLPNTPKDTNRYSSPRGGGAIGSGFIPKPSKDLDWIFQGIEYDPMWPNDYEKAAKDLREMKEREKEKKDEEERRKRREHNREDRSRRGEMSERRRYSDDEEEEFERKMASTSSSSSQERKGGVAIAPPSSLQETNAPLPVLTPGTDPKQFGASVAAKIMAKYGFKEGQGLGKSEQGMSQALLVEKTSKRGGRIIHEKDIMPPPAFGTSTTPPSGGQPESPENIMPPPATPGPSTEMSITEIMKSPSKLVLLKNMVGPGEVDSDLEPEVKDECNTKYGDVIKVLIHELPNAHEEEAVRIFVEFKRIESAIKAVVDLNGRFFGGRQVKAGFYSLEKFNNLELLD